MKILCICPIGIGNYLLTYPACHAIKRTRPDCSLHLLGLREGIRDFAQSDPLWSGVHVFDPMKIKRNVFAQAAIIGALRAEKFDASLNFFPSNKWLYNLLPLMAGIAVRYGFAYHYNPLSTLSFVCSRRIPVDLELHDARQNMHLAAAFCGNDAIAQGALVFPRLFGDKERAWALDFLNGTGPFIAVHPGSSAEHGMAYKRWAPQKFGAVADRICRRLGASCIVMGGAGEEPLKQAVAAAMTSPCRLLEQTSLGNTAALLSLCAVCLCNDSGLMHMASCGGTPVIAIFGPTDEKRNGPIGSQSLVIRKDMPGFPLWRAADAGNRRVPRGINPSASLELLSADEAWARIEPWLEHIAARPFPTRN